MEMNGWRARNEQRWMDGDERKGEMESNGGVLYHSGVNTPSGRVVL